MITTTFQGSTVRLVTEQPDWEADRVRVTVGIPTAKVRGLTGRESRTALAATSRIEMTWTATLLHAEIDSFRNPLQVDSSATDIPFVVPFWPAAVEGASAPDSEISGGLWVGWNEGGTDWILGDEPADVTARDYAAPAMMGRLEAEGEAFETFALRVKLRFTEDSSFSRALGFPSPAWDVGPALADATEPKIFPWAVTWSRSPAGGQAVVEAERRPLGPGREMASTYWPQNAERPLRGAIALISQAEAAAFLAWWRDVRGDTESHLVNCLLEVGRLFVGQTAGNSTIVPVSTDRFGTNGFAVLSDGQLDEWIRITGIDGGALTLSAPLQDDWEADGSFIQLGMLARHARSEVEIEYLSPGFAEVVLDWREVRAEIVPAAGETRGESIGRLADAAWLYALTVDRGESEPTVHRYTSFERALTAAGQTWDAWPAEHSEIRQALALDRDELTLRMRYAEPLSQFIPGRHDAVLRLAIYRCTVSGSVGSTVVQVFGGEATGCRMDGVVASVTFAGANALFGRRVPRYLVQRGCNYRLFEARCGLVLADWDLTATVFAVSGAAVTLESFTPSGSVPVGWGGAHWFALGYLERASGGRALIVDSAAKDGSGRVLLTLLAETAPAIAIGESVTVVPGCDGDFATCQAKFANSARHGGFPWIPDKHPGFQPIRRDEGAGKK